jgi:hypothetical protein
VSRTISQRREWHIFRKLFGFTVPKSDDVLGMKCYDEIFAIAPDYHLSPKKDGVPSEGLYSIRHRHNATHADRAEQAYLWRSQCRSTCRVIHRSLIPSVTK